MYSEGYSDIFDVNNSNNNNNSIVVNKNNLVLITVYSNDTHNIMPMISKQVATQVLIVMLQSLSYYIFYYLGHLH